MKHDEWLKYYIDYTDQRLDRIEKKLDDLSRFRWQIFGGGIVSVFVINMILSVLTK